MIAAEEKARIDAMLRAEIDRIARLLYEAGCTQLERLLDAEGRPTTLTDEQRGMVQRAARSTADRQSLRMILALCVKSDDDLRGSMVGKLERACKGILEVTR